MPDESLLERARGCGVAGLFGVTMFAAVCLGAQFWRSDLDWLAAPLSFYLTGPGGYAVVLAYLALAVGLVAIGRGFGFAVAPFGRVAPAKLLFHVAAIGLAITALSEPAKSFGHQEGLETLHRIAAQTTFISVTSAMLLQAARFLGDPRWRSSFVFAFVLAVAAFGALICYVFDRSLPRGLAQKAVIVLILAWLAWAAFNLYKVRQALPARGGLIPD